MDLVGLGVKCLKSTLCKPPLLLLCLWTVESSFLTGGESEIYVSLRNHVYIRLLTIKGAYIIFERGQNFLNNTTIFFLIFRAPQFIYILIFAPNIPPHTILLSGSVGEPKNPWPYVHDPDNEW